MKNVFATTFTKKEFTKVDYLKIKVGMIYKVMIPLEKTRGFR